MNPYQSHILRLLKSILLRPPEQGRRPSLQFFPGKTQLFGFVGGISMNWWYSDDALYARDAVASLTIQSSPDFKDCDHETAAKVVIETLQEYCIDRGLFKEELLYFMPAETLFACRQADPPELARAIQDAIESNLRNKIGRRCSVYAVARLSAPSFSVEAGGLRLVSINDHDSWRSVVDEGFDFDGWSPDRFNLGGRKDPALLTNYDYNCVLVSDSVGTPAGTRFSSILRFRKIAGLMHAIASRDGLYRPTKSMSVGREFLAQFSHQSLSEGHWSRSDCDTILPRFTSDIVLSNYQTDELGEWYRTVEHCDKDCRDRIDKAANFLNRALNAKDIEAFINYFVTLDALFGRRNAVEESILTGVKKLQLGEHFEEKAAWLFKLRSELVHGGSRYIAEWPEYSRYRKHFRTNPADDVCKLAELAVLGAPKLFAGQQ